MNSPPPSPPPLPRSLRRRVWERRLRAARRCREHPVLHRALRMLLFAEGLLAIVLCLALHAGLVAFVLLVGPLALRVFLGAALLAVFAAAGKALRILLSDTPSASVRELSPADYPRLHALLRETTDALGVPPIPLVHLSCDDFKTGVSLSINLFPPRCRVTLTLAYPLLCALSARAARALFAHEAGHLSRAGATRASPLQRLGFFWLVVPDEAALLLAPWRHSYLSRVAALDAPALRDAEFACDRAATALCGNGALRELLAILAVRHPDSSVETALRNAVPDDPGAPLPSPAAVLRHAFRAPVPAPVARRRLERDLRSLDPPYDPHPALGARLGVDDPDLLLPLARAPADALEDLFGAPGALDALVDGILRDDFGELARDVRKTRELCQLRMDTLAAPGVSPDDDAFRFQCLSALGRKDEARRVLRDARARHPASAALEGLGLLDFLETDPRPPLSAALPAASRLEALFDADPFLAASVEDVLLDAFFEDRDIPRAMLAFDRVGHAGDRARRLAAAPLLPSDDLRAFPLAPGEREDIARDYAGQASEVLVVWRCHAGMGVVAPFHAVRWNSRLPCLRRLRAFFESSEGAVSVPLSPPLFRRLLALRAPRVPVPPRPAPH